MPFDCERADVRAIASERRLSIEAAGHAARYEFFERTAARLHADRVALGHTRDDQAETFLLRLLRGAGPRGLSGMHRRTGQFIRPMLDCSRRQIRQFVARHAIPFREDASNRDVTIARNLIRHDVLPHLARLSPGLVRVLAREADIARDDAEFLEAAARAAFDRVSHEEGESVAIDAGQLRLLPAAVARRVVRAAAFRLAHGRFLGLEHVERVLDLVHNEAGAGRRVNLPGQLVEYDGSCVLFSRGVGRHRARHRNPDEEPNFFGFSLSIPGEVVSPLGWTVSAERTTAGNGFGVIGAVSDRTGAVYPRSWAMLDGAAVASPLVVRTWTPGDRFRPLGMAGTRKLQDFFVDRKVPRAERPRVPIVADGGGRIVWVAGHVIAEDFRVTPAASDVVILKLKYWRHGT